MVYVQVPSSTNCIHFRIGLAQHEVDLRTCHAVTADAVSMWWLTKSVETAVVMIA